MLPTVSDIDSIACGCGVLCVGFCVWVCAFWLQAESGFFPGHTRTQWGVSVLWKPIPILCPPLQCNNVMAWIICPLPPLFFFSLSLSLSGWKSRVASLRVWCTNVARARACIRGMDQEIVFCCSKGHSLMRPRCHNYIWSDFFFARVAGEGGGRQSNQGKRGIASVSCRLNVTMTYCIVIYTWTPIRCWAAFFFSSFLMSEYKCYDPMNHL